MLAASYTRNGSAAEVLQVALAETPQPGPGEVLVQMKFSGVNPSDWKVRKGGQGRALEFSFVIPHSDGSGVIVAVGEGVDASRVGESVWLWNGQWKRAHGTAAQYISLPSSQAVQMPAALSFEEAACLGIPALTALQAVELARIEPGCTVLIQGGAGSVGYYAIQMAKQLGARVITTVSSDKKAEHAATAGADHIINYKTQNVADEVRGITGGKLVDSIVEVDFTGNAASYPGVLRPSGRVVVYGMNRPQAEIATTWFMRNQISLEFLLVYELSAQDRAKRLAQLQAMLAAGALKHCVAATLDLSEIARAHDMVEQGQVMGHVVLSVARTVV
ncbi:MAG: NADPH:quinone reductase [Bdellovibrionales bacterium]|nr:NADPH:quinone reductase [Ramlibacter sp.]